MGVYDDCDECNGGTENLFEDCTDHGGCGGIRTVCDCCGYCHHCGHYFD